METQKLFKSGFINQLKREISDGTALNMYLENKFRYAEDVALVNPTIIIEKPIQLREPDGKDNYDSENAIRLYSAYKNMTPVQATDVRIWTYMSHVTFWNYMRNRWPLDGKKEGELKSLILSHWFIEKLNAKSISRHGIASLWWGAYLTYDDNREVPFELTREFFSYLEYKRGLLEGTLGRCRNFAHGFLEFVIENNNLFKENKENRIRFLMKKVNYIAGYKVFPILSKNEIKKVLGIYKGAITQVWGRPY